LALEDFLIEKNINENPCPKGNTTYIFFNFEERDGRNLEPLV
jgi:hypothetical protein